MRRGRKHRASDTARSLADWRFADRVGVVVFVALIAGLFAFLFFVKMRSQSATYEGRIVDKSITLSESYQGSGKIMQLHLQGSDGVKLSVRVDYDTYNRAQVGMWVRNDGSGPRLSWDEPTPDAANREGAETPSVSAPR